MADVAVKCIDETCRGKLDPILVAAGFRVHLLCTDPTPGVVEPLDVVEMNTALTTGVTAAAPANPFRLEAHVAPSDAITAMVQDAVVDFSQNAPRSLQREIGPSEIGHPCRRHLAYKLVDWPTCNNGQDPLPSMVGTGAHRMMDDVFAFKNEKLGRERFIMDRELTIRPGLTGHGDCFDTDTGFVLDWKFPGTEPMREYRKNIIGQTYRVQLHTYGLGWENAGYTVRGVADVFFSRGGNLLGKFGAHTFYETFDRQVALDALDTLDKVSAIATALDVDTYPERFELIPATPDHCDWCPWHKPKSVDLALGCPGVPDAKEVADK